MLECSGDNARYFVQLDSAQAFSNAWYGHNAECQWRLDCPSGSTVELQFNSFDVENNFDYVYVFDGSAVDSEAQLGRYTGTSLPPTARSSSNSMMVQLTSDGSVAREGFSASYWCEDVVAEPQAEPLAEPAAEPEAEPAVECTTEDPQFCEVAGLQDGWKGCDDASSGYSPSSGSETFRDACPCTCFDCDAGTAVCVESDLAYLQHRNTSVLSAGCRCCFRRARDTGASAQIACLAPVLPPVDFCVDPGSAQSNPGADTGVCRHPCQNYGGASEDWLAAGCDTPHEDHEDAVCVTEVSAPGEVVPWSSYVCCSDCVGKGEGCCGERPDGEIGCYHTECDWMCAGISCIEHEDQPTCLENNGTWVVDWSCEEEIAEQPVLVETDSRRSGWPVGIVGAMWLGRYGDACCTGYEAPGPGSCDLDIEIFVSASSEHLPLHVMARVERYVSSRSCRQDVVAVAVGLLV